MQDLILRGYFDEFCEKHHLIPEGGVDAQVISKIFEQFAIM
jgi:hypothetical protein